LLEVALNTINQINDPLEDHLRHMICECIYSLTIYLIYSFLLVVVPYTCMFLLS
jgi:hypothetical protein